MNKNLFLLFTLLYILFEFFFERYSMYTLFAWVLIAGIYTRGRFVGGTNNKKYVLLFVFLIFYFFSTFLGSNAYKGLTDTIYAFRGFAPILVYDIVRQENYKFKKAIVLFTILCVLIHTYQANLIMDLVGSENGLRTLATQHDEDLYMSTAFAFIYSLPILLSTIVFSIKSLLHNKQRLITALLLIVVLLVLPLVFKSLFVTAMLFTMVGVTIAFFYRKGDPIRKWVFKSSFVVILVVTTFFFSFNYLVDFATQYGNEGTVARVYDLKMSLSGETSKTVDLSERNELRMVSFRTFINHPVFGVHHKMVGAVNEDLVGNHSQWFDDLAEFGLFAILAFVFLFRALAQQYKETRVIIPILIFATLGFFNPVIYPIVSIVTFILCPHIISVFTDSPNINHSWG